ncbi:trihelix transcription factor GTL1 isoform X2 [Raphanus sativus]|uniref:Trihelix transcription factor GTL1 isoform X2 n=1 Tax=Raphanus sativus TaxID=3726 RepID=A0A6J0KJC2_RAPSA|nr:trihelix transcription factor GTL1 isoform X2 [Raphanus sativus]
MEQGGGGGGNEVVEEASPISSRPPANMEELMGFSAAVDDGGGLGGSSSSSSGNRWPREETLALLRIRSEMDSTFRDATLKAPLWEHVSRKLLELGYKRSAKKCKEKFENVQKYHKRTKETRGGGRHEGKTYKFFSQLEALNTTPPPSSLDVAPLSVANPAQQPSPSSQFPVFSLTQTPPSQPLPPHTVSFTPNPLPPPPLPSVGPTFPGGTFSSHSSSTASGMESDDEDNMDVDLAGPSSHKRKRENRGGTGPGKMMELFEGLVRQVMQKQAAMQRSFLEAVEKREQERLAREEAWKRQETSRLAREHEIMSQHRAASASRDAAIISLIQKITGHTIQLPPSLSSQPPPAAKRPSQAVEPPHLQPIMAIPQQQVLPPPPPPPPHQQQEMIMSSDQSSPSSSRWPKEEILALINLRSGMEPRYQDNVPKGLLWEEISTSMKRMGYNRNAKRCKEKWENINKYYKKVKESNKKRPQDAKTCPYYHRLDLLYSNKVLGSGAGSSTSGLPQDQLSTIIQKQSPVSAMKPSQEGDVNVHQTHGSASSDEEEPREETPQGAEKKTL